MGVAWRAFKQAMQSVRTWTEAADATIETPLGFVTSTVIEPGTTMKVLSPVMPTRATIETPLGFVTSTVTRPETTYTLPAETYTTRIYDGGTRGRKTTVTCPEKVYTAPATTEKIVSPIMATPSSPTLATPSTPIPLILGPPIGPIRHVASSERKVSQAISPSHPITSYNPRR